MDENDLNNPFASKPMPGIGLEKLEEHKELPDPLATPELPIRPDVVEIPEHNSSGKRIGFVSKILWIGVLFVAGIGLSLLYQQLINRSNEELINRNDIIYTEESTPSSSVNQNTKSSWYEYEVLESFNKFPLDSLTVKLPPDALEPVCDGANCSSYGTYLPGGTRLTIATKMVSPGANLSDSSIVDISGNKFTTSDTKIFDKTAKKYSGEFIGTTTGGYKFTKMEGVMIQVKPTLILEINHFTPSGIDADFESDATLLEQITQSISMVNLTSTPKPLN